MSLPEDLNIREHRKFRTDKNGDTIVAVALDELEPTNSLYNNPSAVYTYTSGNLTKITKTINGTSYEKTFTYDGSNFTNSSEWTQV